ncbi:phosphate transport system substrate-binding protein [Desulfohalotomaculum tongense]|uniref:phosphate ABC transporter substrate-binding protein n=1 Tax=Desulforadius tongensis TaxID=1216062 RepID=UPI00195C8926|nr:phosphate ABC transporter substrate-binding protein [Desulforadius tongensis]MBM7854087.1 phosphate transport system substrate-binding protein [Desulforadius tongensis]
MIKRTLVIFLLLALLAAGCGSKAETIRIVGSTSMQPVSEVLAQHFKQRHPGVQIFVQGGDSEIGMRSIKNNIAEIGSLSRPLTADEKKLVNAYEIIEDSISIIVNNENKVDCISLQQLKDIFTGKITNWKQIGGADYSISVISREEGSGTYNMLKDIVIGSSNEIVDTASIMTSTGAVRTTVSRDKYAIGYVSSAYVNKDVKLLKIVNEKNEPVKLSRPLIYITGKEADNITKQFLQFALSDEAQKIITKILRD